MCATQSEGSGSAIGSRKWLRYSTATHLMPLVVEVLDTLPTIIVYTIVVITIDLYGFIR